MLPRTCFPHIAIKLPRHNPTRYNICIYSSITSYVLQKVFHCPLLCYFYANYGKFSECGCLTWWLLQVKWEPHGNDLSHLPPSFRIEESNVWRSTVPLICFWLVEFHLLDRVLQQFGLKQEQPRDANTNRDLHKIDVRGKVEKNWSVEHAVHIQKWNDRNEYVCNALRMEGVMSLHHPYMVWYHRITRLYIDCASAKMEILVMCINLCCFACCV